MSAKKLMPFLRAAGEIEEEEFLLLMANYVGPQGAAKDEDLDEVRAAADSRALEHLFTVCVCAVLGAVLCLCCAVLCLCCDMCVGCLLRCAVCAVCRGCWFVGVRGVHVRAPRLPVFAHLFAPLTAASDLRL